jgi:hypothetical protein
MREARSSRRPAPADGGPRPDPDANKGSLEGDRPGQVQQGNANVPALDENGQPADLLKICEDVIGANADHSEG